MQRDLSKKITEILSKYAVEKERAYRVLEQRTGVQQGFHQWADGRNCDGVFLVKPNDGAADGLWLTFVQWHQHLDKPDFYLVLLNKQRNRVLAEIHDYSETDGDIQLRWKYAPKKRDQWNSDRKAIFVQAFLSEDVQIALPNTVDEVDDFLDELFSLADCRIKADARDNSLPILRKGFPEGKIKEKLHLSRERNPELVRQAKALALKRFGKLACVCCGFDFHAAYGEIGKGFIEAHHTKPISDLHTAGEETCVEDLALVCSNCHSILHRKRPWLQIDKLSELKKQTPPV